MDLHPATKTTYNFIHDRTNTVREGFSKEGENLIEVYQQYQFQGQEFVMGLKESFGDHIADLLNCIIPFFL